MYICIYNIYNIYIIYIYMYNIYIHVHIYISLSHFTLVAFLHLPFEFLSFKYSDELPEICIAQFECKLQYNSK